MDWGRFFQALTAAGAIFTGVAVLVAYYGIKQQHDWNRRQYTLELVRQVNNELRELREPLREAFPKLFHDRALSTLSKGEAEALFNACPLVDTRTPRQGEFTCEARGTAGAYLNLLEEIAVAHWNHVADRSIVEISFAGMILEDYGYFENFVQHVQTVRKRPVYETLQNVVAYLRQQRRTLPPSPEPTGQ